MIKNLHGDPITQAYTQRSDMSLDTCVSLAKYGFIRRVPVRQRTEYAVMIHDRDTMIKEAKRRFFGNNKILNYNEHKFMLKINAYAVAVSGLHKGKTTDDQLKMILKPRLYDIEALINIDSNDAVVYSCVVARERWPEIENHLIKRASIEQLCYYCANAVKKRWSELESWVANEITGMENYIGIALREPWPEQEDFISQHSQLSREYAILSLKHRFMKGEPVILQSSINKIMEYACAVVHGDWPEAEKIIFDNWKNTKRYFECCVKAPLDRYEEKVINRLEVYKTNRTIGETDNYFWKHKNAEGMINVKWLVEYCVKYRKYRWPEIEWYLMHFTADFGYYQDKFILPPVQIATSDHPNEDNQHK